MAGGRYGGLRDEVFREDVDWVVGGGEDLDLDLDEYDISCRVVYDGSLLSAAAGAVMRRHTWKEYGVNI